jgi:hypothetical protein
MPDVQSRGMKIKVEHPFEPELALVRNPLTFSGTPIKNNRAPAAARRRHQRCAGDDRR